MFSRRSFTVQEFGSLLSRVGFEPRVMQILRFGPTRRKLLYIDTAEHFKRFQLVPFKISTVHLARAQRYLTSASAVTGVEEEIEHQERRSDHESSVGVRYRHLMFFSITT